ncbi:GNAT family N-acetyltransferase [uncultured Tenacibaculum sp.]|uniref:GNAT family N-acetyltransferase n=1 Tax=uncultured Tenacibaculum sp. TaxID=174713 RepID=UPI0026361B2F|nr:GNAT family N-acetyltransferase [uncultured Tenacibaculum sp.]
MISLVRTDSENKDFKALVKQLDAFLAVTDGDDHDFYNQYNKLDLIKHVVLIYVDNEPLACGAIKQYDITTMEIKRMFTSEKARGKGFASQILKALEIWAKELSFNRCILETGIRQVEAVHLYKKNNYKIIENYGQYSGLEESICFEKYLD